MINLQLLKTNLIKSNSSIYDAIRSLNESNEKICLVLTNKKKLCGVITDGDLRRIILKEKILKKF